MRAATVFESERELRTELAVWHFREVVSMLERVPTTTSS
jgi:hypothetical protein